MLLEVAIRPIRRHVAEERVAAGRVLPHAHGQTPLQVLAQHVLVVAANLVDAIAEEEEMVVGVAVERRAEHDQHPVRVARLLRVYNIRNGQHWMLRHKVLAHRGEPSTAKFALQKRIYAVAQPGLAAAADGDFVPFNLVDAFLVFQQGEAGFAYQRTRCGGSKFHRFSGYGTC